MMMPRFLPLVATLLLTGCSRQALLCLTLDGASCPDRNAGGGSSLSAPLPPPPPDPCSTSSSASNNQCSSNPLGLATACDPTDADGDPYDDDCSTTTSANDP